MGELQPAQIFVLQARFSIFWGSVHTRYFSVHMPGSTGRVGTHRHDRPRSRPARSGHLARANCRLVTINLMDFVPASRRVFASHDPNEIACYRDLDCDLCSGRHEAIYRFAKSRRARESGWTLVMGNTGRAPVCRGLVSETAEQHALRLVAQGGGQLHAHRLTEGALATIPALHAHSSAPHNGKVDPSVWPRDSAPWC